MRLLRRKTGMVWLIAGVTALALLPPVADLLLPGDLQLSRAVSPILIFAVLGLGLNVVTGYTGLLNFGVAAFMALGAYSYAILTCEIYPFQLTFALGLLASLAIGAAAGVLLGLPTLRLSGDYIAIVTLGFGEIVQDVLKNLDTITKGTQGINPVPGPSLFGISGSPIAVYFVLLLVLLAVVLASRNLERSRVGRTWIAIREDELAAASSGVNPIKTKLLALSCSAAVCSLGGALWAAFLGTTGEPGNYDFQISVICLCIIIVGGMGSIPGVIFGAVLVIGANSLILGKLSAYLVSRGLSDSSAVYLSPANYKFLLFGLLLVLAMRFRPEGLMPSKRVRRELHDDLSGGR